MSGVSVSQSSGPLRRDLVGIPVDARPRPYRLVHDEIGGRYARIAEHLWQALKRGEGDESLWREARAAGWTRERTESKRRSFSPLHFRLPLMSADTLAARLAAISGIFFSAMAFPFWSVLIVLAGVSAASRSAELFHSLSSLQLFLKQSNPFWMAVWFAMTKSAHELAHAVMCRRMGARCGKVGLLFLVGIPCPYCDVTDIWRQPSPARRAAVMMAGIYIELIIASLATLMWVSASDPVLRLHALNLMVICGISTIVFNANPLMRYDGYYVLGDLIGTANLRQESSHAFAAVVTARIAGRNYRLARRSDRRSVFLACFHAASTVYRLLIVIAIASLLIGVAASLHLRGIAVGVAMLAMVAAVIRGIRRLAGIALASNQDQASNHWRDVPPWRRFSVAIGIAASSAVMLFLPLPRYRSADGHVDAACAVSVYLPHDGAVESVSGEIGDSVRSGAELCKLQSDTLQAKQVMLRGQLQVARLRARLSRRRTIDRPDTANQWETTRAMEQAVASQLASVTKRAEALQVRAPVGGMLLPVQPALRWTADRRLASSLHDRVGTSVDAGQAWCRISPDGHLDGVLLVDARDRSRIDIGTEVRISLLQSPQRVYRSTVTSVSAIEQADPSPTREAAYRVLCPLPEVDEDGMLPLIGQQCTGVFHLPNRSLASDMAMWLSEWLGGKE